MAYGDEKVIIDLRVGEHNELIWKSPEGPEQTYHPHSNTVWLKADELRLFWAYGGDEAAPLRLGVRGTVSLERDRDISVIGEPTNKARRFSLGIWSEPEPEARVQRDEAVLADRLTSAYGAASLGFNRADWEIGTENDWWVSIYVRPDALDALVEGLKAGLVKELTLGLFLKNLFSDHHPYAPISECSHLFLRPNARDNTLEMPELASGMLSSISFSGPVAALKAAAPEVAPEPDDVPEAVVAVVTPSPVTVSSIEDLARRVDALRMTLKWVGGFIVLALLAIATGR